LARPSLWNGFLDRHLLELSLRRAVFPVSEPRVRNVSFADVVRILLFLFLPILLTLVRSRKNAALNLTFPIDVEAHLFFLFPLQDYRATPVALPAPTRDCVPFFLPVFFPRKVFFLRQPSGRKAKPSPPDHWKRRSYLTSETSSRIAMSLPRCVPLPPPPPRQLSRVVDLIFSKDFPPTFREMWK